MYKAMFVDITDGKISKTAFFSNTKTIKSFISDSVFKKAYIGDTKIHITHGDEVNGEGWVFIKK